MDTTSILESLLKVLFPDSISLHFEIASIEEYPTRIDIRMDELKELVPQELYESDTVLLDGFCNPIELQSFPLKGKPVYLRLYRRRWKGKGCVTHFSNSYDIHPKGVKATKDFASFLKGAFGQSPDEYNRDLKGFVH